MTVQLRHVVGVFVLAACAYLLVFGVPGGDGEPSAESVAAKIGATRCANSGYEFQNRLDGSQQTIFDCTTGSTVRCVTIEGGIARDATVTARLIFQDVIGGEKPACIGPPGS